MHTANMHVSTAERTFHVYTRPDEIAEFELYADALFYDEPRHDAIALDSGVSPKNESRPH